jgi:uncharacterized protein YecA (UPF0149 family)
MTSYSLPPLTPELLMVIPRRTSLGDQFEQLPLDRRERMALMLVDGQRTIETHGDAPEAGQKGQAPIQRAGPRVGRNDPCPCGSGKKYKNCCMRMSAK